MCVADLRHQGVVHMAAHLWNLDVRVEPSGQAAAGVALYLQYLRVFDVCEQLPCAFDSSPKFFAEHFPRVLDAGERERAKTVGVVGERVEELDREVLEGEGRQSGRRLLALELVAVLLRLCPQTGFI